MSKERTISSVLIVPSHHDFYEGNFFAQKDKKEIPDNAVELTEEMLSWPRYDFHGVELLDKDWENLYKSALGALLSIPPFDSQVSLGTVDVAKKQLHFSSKRDWSRIYFGNQSVVGFNHDTRFSNRPFYSIVEWTEQADDDESMEHVKKWNVDQWREFFYGRIRRNAEVRSNVAHAKILEGQKKESEAEAVLLALSL